MIRKKRIVWAALVFSFLILIGTGCSKAGMFKAEDATPEVIIGEIMAQWAESESLAFNCRLDFLLKAKDGEKSDFYDVELRARKPKHLVLEALNDKAMNVLVYNGEYLYFFAPNNRFGRAPMEGDLKTLQNSAKLAAFPMILLEMFIADTPTEFLSRFESANVETIENGVRVILKRNRETVMVNWLNRDKKLISLEITHDWTFPGETPDQTNPDLSLSSTELYKNINTKMINNLDDLAIANVATDLKARGLLKPKDEESTPTVQDKKEPEHKK
jgi:hypothetical protein